MSSARPSPFGDTTQVLVAEHIARLVVAGFGLCNESGFPLTDRQKIALLTAALLEFDGVREEVSGLRRIELLLAEVGGNGSPPAGDES